MPGYKAGARARACGKNIDTDTVRQLIEKVNVDTVRRLIEKGSHGVEGGNTKLIGVQARSWVAVTEPDRRLSGDYLDDTVGERANCRRCPLSLHRTDGPFEAVWGHISLHEAVGVIGSVELRIEKIGDDPPATATFVFDDNARGRPIVPRGVGNGV